MSEGKEQQNGNAVAGRDYSALLDAAEFPKHTLWMRLRWRLRAVFSWKQCKGQHAPYAHLTDDECDSFWIGKNENKKVYYCIRRRWHFGQHEDIHGRRW